MIFWLLSFPAFTQNASNPVQVTSNLIPPYSLYLSDYSDASQNKWNIQLLLKDFTKTDYQAKLRITIEGAGIRLRTRHGFSAGPISLNPGIPYQVDATDLSRYLNLQNMEISGINRNQLASTQKLPEGFYHFKIEVLDYNRNNRVSNIGTSMAWLVLNDPPLLNLPFEEKIRIQDPQQVQFQWTPRHTSSPNSAFETEYIFRLWEIWPEGRDPNEVARTTQPLLERNIMTTSYFYGLNDAMLIPGRSYAWQVQALNLNGRDLFKNQGNSEVRWFKYGDECLPITNLGAEAMGTDRIRISWEGRWNHNQYVAQIRKTGEEEWTSYGTNIETQVVYDLEANTEYQIRVLPSCGALEGTAENTLTLSTLEQEINELDCGAESNLPLIENRELIAQLNAGDRITAAGFTVILREVIKNGDTYTGMGMIEVPLFNSARVEATLNSIKVNTDKQLIAGNVESTLNPNGPFILDMDPEEELSEEGGNEDETEETPDTDIEIDEVITDVEVDEETGEIVVTTEDGETTTVDPDEEGVDENQDGDIVIEDSNGDTWVVGPDGTVSPGQNTGGPSNPSTLPSDAAIDFIVNFEESDQQEYGFDAKSLETLSSYYTQTQIRDNNYWLAWKSVASGRTDKVLAKQSSGDSFNNAIGFKTITGNLPITAASEDLAKNVTVQGTTHQHEQVVQAYVLKEIQNDQGETTEEEIILGELNVISYDKLSQKVVIVPVNGVAAPMASTLSNELNRIYGQAVAEWEVVMAGNYTSEMSLEGLDDEESSMLSAYSSAMNDFKREYRRNNNIDRDAYYVFLMSGTGSSKSGYMPFKRQYGFIFSDNTNDLTKTIAHELGHGAFRLRHTFSNEGYIASQGSTNNLMDYSDGTKLYKHQWDLVHDPENVNTLFEDDEESASGIFCKQFVSDLLSDISEKNSSTAGTINSTWSGQMVECEVMFDFELQNSDITLTDLYFETTLTEDVDIDFYSDVYKKTELSNYDGIENDYIRFDFGEYDVDEEAVPIYSFIVLDEEAEDFEEYLFSDFKNELSESELAILRVNSDLGIECAVSIAGQGAGCNIASRMYLYQTKNDDVLYPKEECDLEGHCTDEGNIVLDGEINCYGRADQIYTDLEDNLLTQYFEDYSRGDDTYKKFFEEMQEDANEGEIIIGVIHSRDRPFTAGHIIIILPEKLYSQTNTKVDLFVGTTEEENDVLRPIALEAGGANKAIKPLANYQRIEKYEWYKYKK